MAGETKNPESYSELFPGRFLKSDSFKGKAVTLTVAEVKLEKMPDRRGTGGEKWKAIVAFRESEMQLVLNKTNGECLRGMFGARLADWAGKRVTFYPARVRAFGKATTAIRVLGSPDLEKDMVVELTIGTDTEKATMKKTSAKKTQPAPEPEAETFDAETGEVHEAADAPF